MVTYATAAESAATKAYALKNKSIIPANLLKLYQEGDWFDSATGKVLLAAPAIIKKKVTAPAIVRKVVAPAKKIVAPKKVVAKPVAKKAAPVAAFSLPDAPAAVPLARTTNAGVSQRIGDTASAGARTKTVGGTAPALMAVLAAQAAADPTAATNAVAALTGVTSAADSSNYGLPSTEGSGSIGSFIGAVPTVANSASSSGPPVLLIICVLVVVAVAAYFFLKKKGAATVAHAPTPTPRAVAAQVAA